MNAISRAKDEVVGATRYRELSDAMLQRAATEEHQLLARKCCEVAAVYEVYEQAKSAKGRVDFGDLVSMPVHLCEGFPEVREHLAKLYDHVLVDEFQDVNRSSVRLLQNLCPNGENLWVVGDAKQSIYRFRGASSFNISRFGEQDFAGGRRERLSVNFRSTAEIRDAFVAFAADMKVNVGLEAYLDVERGESHHTPEIRSVDGDDDEVAAVAEAIEEMRGAGYSYRDQAILCSGNDRLGRFAQALEQLGIPVLYLGSLFERSEIRELLSLLSLLVDRRAMGLLRVAAMPQFQVPLSDVATLFDYLKENDRQALGWASELPQINGLSHDGGTQLKRIAELLAGFAPTADPWEALSLILLDRTRLAVELVAGGDARSQSRGIALWQFLNFVRNQPGGPGLAITRLLERIRRLVLHADERDLRQLPAVAQRIDAVRLFTMHGSKGLEFPVVHIPGLTAQSMPQSPGVSLARGILPPDGLVEGATGTGGEAARDAVVEEQECLFFVALSRARDRLFLYHALKTANGRARNRSPFLNRLGDRVRSRHMSPKVRLPESDIDRPVPVTIEGRFRFSDHQLGLYERCARRFLYTHILNVGGRRTESAFMKLHTVVQNVVNELSTVPEVQVSEADLAAKLDEQWTEHGPADHGYEAEYRAIAGQLVKFFVSSTRGMKQNPIPELRLPVPGGEIVITPDQQLTGESGQVVIRRVRTGHRRSTDTESLGAAAFQLAAVSHSRGCTVELVYLSDEAIAPLQLSPKQLANRREKIHEMADAVCSGQFPANPGITCPRCPAFFACGTVPAGPLQKKFPE